MLNIFGIRALVTGGSRGIGLSIAEVFARAGSDVVLNSYDDTAKAQKECVRLRSETGRRVEHIDADVGDPKAARAMVRLAAEILGGLDIVVSNAGICKFSPFLEIDDDNWQRHIDVNLSGGFWVTQTASQIMVKQGIGGRIIFTASIGSFRSNATQTHYCATKGGIHLLAQGMALELGKHRITVNCIAPGWIHTDINDAQSRDEAIVEPFLQAKVPLGRLGKPTDLQGAALFLASKEAEYVSGATLSVDGGWNAQL